MPDQAILLALDRRDREREMVSVLLAALSPKPLSQDDVALGFTALVLASEVGRSYKRCFRVAGHLTHSLFG